jgi:hypothetical protein
MRVKSTSTPPSPKPQNALQKSSDRGCESGVLARTYFDREVVEGWRRADMVRRQRMVSDSERVVEEGQCWFVVGVSSMNMASLAVNKDHVTCFIAKFGPTEQDSSASGFVPVTPTTQQQRNKLVASAFDSGSPFTSPVSQDLWRRDLLLDRIAENLRLIGKSMG